MKHHRALGALLVATALGVTACGSGESATSPSATKTIDVTMTDNKFTPSSLTVDTGQKVVFRFTNDGKLDHEALIGTKAEQDDHEDEMSGGSAMGGMDHGGAAEAITVKPGKTATLTRTFDTAGTMIIGCHVPGHYESGMKATINVT
ncbi:MAG: cupredoxin domain-containing protein [Aquihabitans sp.]